jgi:hypothetical protein
MEWSQRIVLLLRNESESSHVTTTRAQLAEAQCGSSVLPTMSYEGPVFAHGLLDGPYINESSDSSDSRDSSNSSDSSDSSDSDIDSWCEPDPNPPSVYDDAHLSGASSSDSSSSTSSVTFSDIDSSFEPDPNPPSVYDE